MGPINKDNLSQVVDDLLKVSEGRGKFVKRGPREYFWDPLMSHPQLAQASEIFTRPLDAGLLRADLVGQIRTLEVEGGSVDFKIKRDNPERAATIFDFRSYAEGANIVIN